MAYKQTIKRKKDKPKEPVESYSIKRKSQRALFLEGRDKEYNGWTNYMTWDVALNIDNEQYFQEETYRAIKEGEINNSDELKDWFKQNLEDSGNYNEDFHSYKLSDAWSERELDDDVNWYEIYETYKENIKKEEEYAKKKDSEPFIPSGMEELHKDSITKKKHYPYGDD